MVSDGAINKENEAGLNTKASSVQRIYNWYATGKLRVNRRYQRKLVWTLEEKRALVDSIAKDYPIPAIILSEAETGTYEIIDGMQRLHTIIGYIEQDFDNNDGRYFDVAKHSRALAKMNEKGKEIKDKELITDVQVSDYLDYELPISILTNATDSRVEEVFRRINSYGRQLSDQERRQAGIVNPFADMVRQIASFLRQDNTSALTDFDKIPEVQTELDLSELSSISVDSPKMRMGYSVAAEDTFWLRQGILNGAGLRQSEDEQCIADICSSIALKEMIERSKDAADALYDEKSDKYARLMTAVQAYNPERLMREVLFCIAELDKIGLASGMKLQRLVYGKNGLPAKNANKMDGQFPNFVFAVHELLVKSNKKITDYERLARDFSGLSEKLNTARDSVSVKNRKENVKFIKAVIQEHLEPLDSDERRFLASGLEVENVIRSSPVESSRLEFKQGCIDLGQKRTIDNGVFQKVIETICGIANIPTSSSENAGYVIVGVADKRSDASRIQKLDGIDPVEVNGKFVVGVEREWRSLKWGAERYFQKWRDAIANSELSPTLAGSVLSVMSLSEVRGRHVLYIPVPAQPSPSSVGEKFFVRKGDQTVSISPQGIPELAMSFRGSAPSNR